MCGSCERHPRRVARIQGTGSLVAHSPVGASIAVSLVCLPDVYQAIVVTVLNRCAEDNCPPRHAALVGGSRHHHCRLRRFTGLDRSINRQEPGRIVPGAAAAERNHVLVIDPGERRVVPVERGEQGAMLHYALGIVIVQVNLLEFIGLTIANDVGDLRRYASTLIIPRLKEPQHRLAHSLRGVAGGKGAIVDDDRVERNCRRQSAVYDHKSRAQGERYTAGLSTVDQAHRIRVRLDDVYVRIYWYQITYIRAVSHDGF